MPVRALDPALKGEVCRAPDQLGNVKTAVRTMGALLSGNAVVSLFFSSQGHEIAAALFFSGIVVIVVASLEKSS